MSATIVFRFRFPKSLGEDPAAASVVAEVLSRPCFSRLERVAGDKEDKLVERKKATAERIAEYLARPDFEAVDLDNGGSDVIAHAVIPTGRARAGDSPVRLHGYIAVPFDPAAAEEIVRSACDLARAVDLRSGAITLEPDYGAAQKWALENPRPKPRAGLTERRLQERRAHRRSEDDLATVIGGPEWGTFLSTGHLERVDRQALSAAAFNVVELAPGLAFVQATADPMDEFADGFDAKLAPLREALVLVLADLSAMGA